MAVSLKVKKDVIFLYKKPFFIKKAKSRRKPKQLQKIS
jgi:hypothetical protein